MSDLGVQAEFDTAELQALVDSGVSAIQRAVGLMATQLGEEDLPGEAPRGATGALSEAWKPSERDPLTWVVTPSPNAWYAHIVARGSRAHGPRRAQAMTVEGRFVTHVSGVPANPFDRRAVATTERAADALLAAALAAEGIT